MGVGKALLVKGITLVIVLLAVLSLIVIVLGATGVSDRILEAYVSEQLRQIRQELSQRIKDPAQLEQAIESYRQELRSAFGLDKPWYLRLPDMVWRVLTLDLGKSRSLTSFSGSNEVAVIVLERIPNTVVLITTAVVISALIGIFSGVKIATKAGSRLDRAVSFLSSISYAMPSWWTGIIFILVFSFYFRIFPPGGMYSTPPPEDPFTRGLDLLRHAALPVLTLVTAILGGWIYVSRTIVLNVAQEDFVEAARVRGLPERIVMWRYILRPAAPPIMTNVVFSIAGSIGGAILTETVFNWPGMGRLYYEAITAFDEPLIVALTFLFTLIYIITRFILEVLYVLLDPRVRY
ncbi:MAG TPA: ABC transporter permease [Candidatus Caldiarchaeum subterraneum]|uniref:ABC transporter permease n=1 Tax=Caldiarchaeum subterraneum TaxID=311458 RepID=A0A832ZVP0_CALS0|nr:ABC transporter permease [Candidatus Caldarchaeum subterraneum]